MIFQKICCPYLTEADCECPSCMQKLQSTIDYAFKLCGSIGLFFSFTEVKVHELFCILYTLNMYIYTFKKCSVKIYIMLNSITFVKLFYFVRKNSDLFHSILVNVNLLTHCSLLVFGWPCGTGIRKIHELILVLSSSLTPSLCPLSPHMILLIDGGWFHVVIFYFIYWYLGEYFY